MLSRALVGLSLIAGLVTTVAAAPMILQFTVTGFPVGAPTDPVSGTIRFNAASPFADIDNLISIDLTIAGHAYALAETGSDPFTATRNIIGGTLNNVDTVAAGTTDFFLVYDQSLLTGLALTYSAPGLLTVPGLDFTSFSITADPAVPLPSSLALLVIGIAGLGWSKRTRGG